jgi:hypothetical protein
MGEFIFGAIVFACMIGVGVMAVLAILVLTGAGIEKAAREDENGPRAASASSGR